MVKARPCKVKWVDPVVKRYRVRRDGGTGGSNATGASHRALIHAGWCGGMFEEAARVSGAWLPLTDGDDTVVDVLGNDAASILLNTRSVIKS